MNVEVPKEQIYSAKFKGISVCFSLLKVIQVFVISFSICMIIYYDYFKLYATLGNCGTDGSQQVYFVIQFAFHMYSFKTITI